MNNAILKNCIWLELLILSFVNISFAKSIPPQKEKFQIKISNHDQMYFEHLSLIDMYAGYIPSNFDTEKTIDINTFFWKFDNNVKTNDYLTIWFNGGFDCSTMNSALLETSPFKISNDGIISYNNNTWLTNSDLIYVDQLNYKNEDFNKKKINSLNTSIDYFLDFLDDYFNTFPEDLNKKIILAGRGYSGQYLPSIAKKILERNKLNNIDGKIIKLDGLILGNSWLDSDIQSLSFLPYAIENNIINETSSKFKFLEKEQNNCLKQIDTFVNNKPINYEKCQRIIKLISAYSRDLTPGLSPKDVCVNLFNIQLRDFYPPCGMSWPISDYSSVSSFFSNPLISNYFHLDRNLKHHWDDCDNLNYNNFAKYEQLQNLQSNNIIQDLIDKNSDLNILFFSGDKDLVFNNIGIKKFLNGLHLPNLEKKILEGSSKLNWLQRYLNTDEKEKVGEIYFLNDMLTFIDILNGSHVIGYDKPWVSEGILEVYLNKNNHDIIKSQDNTIINNIEYKAVEKEKLIEDFLNLDTDAYIFQTNSEYYSSTYPRYTNKTYSNIQFRIVVIIIITILVLILIYNYLVGTYWNNNYNIIKTNNDPELQGRNLGQLNTNSDYFDSESFIDYEQEDSTVELEIDTKEIHVSESEVVETPITPSTEFFEMQNFR